VQKIVKNKNKMTKAIAELGIRDRFKS